MEKTGIELIAAERKRQIKEEGRDKEHDESHYMGELASAAACYEMTAELRQKSTACRWKLKRRSSMTTLFETLVSWVARCTRRYNARCWRTNEWY